ncbi:hypothetical protein [Actinomadura algeriensis]|uniref:SUKH-4 immunity protein of toxin-antitoxin system n=1 Tax=Actinomadura algeriensis TaxID=1679523 RepID=A0ABR9JRL9_9ACTN|nr:hypothetical protein [Actinomadura algeriensis]MBE1533213.1 hypothetical protein [Actinomadura algeriensis]
MVPEFNVESYVDYDPARLREITAEDVATYPGPGYNQEYEPLVDVSWADARATLEIERAALDRAGKAEDAAGFEDILEAVADEAYEEEDNAFAWCVQGLDLGVAGLAMALVAAGGATYTSCRGRAPGSIHLQEHPLVGVVLDAPRAALVAEFVLAAGCCLYMDRDGHLAVGAPTVEHCHRLAKLIVEKSELFDRFPPQSWREGLEELLE